MLRKLLQLLNDRETLALAEIAEQLQVTPGQVAVLMDELTRLGYLKMSVRCGGACAGCALAQSCSGIQAQRVWQITERGRQALQKP